MVYKPAEYWSSVGDRIEARGGDVVAGDDTPYFRYKRRRFLERFLENLEISGKRVLEVGPGPGGNLTFLSGRGATRLVGVDVAPTMVRLARARGHEVHETDGNTLPFEDQEFDVVFSATVLHHNPRIDSLLGEMCRVARRVVLFEDTAPTHRRESDAFFRRTRAEYATIAGACGYRLVESEPLRISASTFAHRVAMAVADRRGRDEGEPVPSLVARVERLLLPATMRLDRYIPPRRTLSKMVFSSD